MKVNTFIKNSRDDIIFSYIVIVFSNFVAVLGRLNRRPRYFNASMHAGEARCDI